MIGILSLEIISVTSLIFAVLNILFNPASLEQIFILFIYTVVVSTITAILQKKNKIYRALMALLLIPLIFFNTKDGFWFILYLTVFSCMYMVKGMGKGNYSYFSRRLKSSFVIISSITIFVVLTSVLRSFLMPGVVFTIIYLLSSIILVRSLRHLESGMDMKKLRNINLKYLALMTLISIAITVDFLRNIIAFGMWKIYEIIIKGILAILFLPIRLFSVFIEKIIEWITEGYPDPVGVEESGIEFSENGANYTNLIKSDAFREVLLDIFALIVFLVVIYVAYKILSKIGNRDTEGLKYQEQREYIKKSEKKKRRLWERYPKKPREQIRYYYRKYLRDVEKKKVDIKASYTSLDVKENSKNIFRNADQIRDIYIKARYARKEVEPEDVVNMKKTYRKN